MADFDLGDPYTGKEFTRQGKKVNMDDGTYVEGGVRYLYTGEDDPDGFPLFMPEGGWSDTPQQLATDELYIPGSELNPIDPVDNQPALIQVRRADGTVQPGAWTPNPAAYVAPVKPADADTAPSGKYTTTQDERGNTVWNISPGWKGGAGGGKTGGTGTTPSTGTGVGADGTPKEDAFSIVDDLVRSYGLDKSIADFIKGQMRTAQSRTAIAMKIREQQAYHLRFPAMKTRIDAGLPALTENEYMALETDYRSAMQAANLPENFSDGPEDFAALIAGDVSVAEVQSRVALAEQSVDQANQDTIAQLQSWYDLPKGSLVAYFLDPDAAKNVFEQNRRMEAAGLSVGAMRAIGPDAPWGGTLAKSTAERLQREGVAQNKLVERLSARRGLAGATLGAEALTADELALGEFGITSESVTRIRRESEQRASGFRGQGGTLMSQGGFAGLGTAE